MDTHEDTDALFARDGHLSVLSLDRFEHGELRSPHLAVVSEHLAGCECCQQRIQAVRAFAAEVTIAPPPSVSSHRSTGSVTIGYMVATAGVAIAASLLLAIVPSPQRATQIASPEATGVAGVYTSGALDEARASLGLEVFARSSDDGAAQLIDVRVESEVDGYVAAFAVADEAFELPEPDEGYDGGTGGQVQAEVDVLDRAGDRLVRAEAGAEVRFRHSLPLGSTVGGLQIVVVACDEPLDVDTAATLLAAGEGLDSDCVVKQQPVPTLGARDS